jgi:hypothetical protein
MLIAKEAKKQRAAKIYVTQIRDHQDVLRVPLACVPECIARVMKYDCPIPIGHHDTAGPDASPGVDCPHVPRDLFNALLPQTAEAVRLGQPLRDDVRKAAGCIKVRRSPVKGR